MKEFAEDGTIPTGETSFSFSLKVPELLMPSCTFFKAEKKKVNVVYILLAQVEPIDKERGYETQSRMSAIETIKMTKKPKQKTANKHP